jgi:hypothetical protein
VVSSGGIMPGFWPSGNSLNLDVLKSTTHTRHHTCEGILWHWCQVRGQEYLQLVDFNDV